MKKILLALVFIAFISAGCRHNENNASVKSSKNVGRDGSHLCIGIVPERNIFSQAERYQLLADYISKTIGIKVNLKILPQYGNVIKDFKSYRLDGAFFGSFTYVLAQAKLGVEVLVRPESIDGSSDYYGMIFVRKDSRIVNVGDMRDKRFVFVDRATTAGYLLPLSFFAQYGVTNYETYLKETYFAGTHEDAIYDVLNKKADIGAAKNTVYERLAREDPRIEKELSVIYTSPRVPENGLAVRRDLSPEIRNGLKEALLKMHTTPEGKSVLKAFEARRFIETADDNYAPVAKYIHTIHLDLAAYDR
ncbi:MAG: phosphate/phosphite/phosphonate ABC transporter substrate-binding protein [Nitrospirae bacterium]|nr:phosphate/phosphite/phosphonate ABC transporter substrate-binding protein [Nitrospirota bacterium]